MRNSFTQRKLSFEDDRKMVGNANDCRQMNFSSNDSQDTPQQEWFGREIELAKRKCFVNAAIIAFRGWQETRNRQRIVSDSEDVAAAVSIVRTSDQPADMKTSRSDVGEKLLRNPKPLWNHRENCLPRMRDLCAGNNSKPRNGAAVSIRAYTSAYPPLPPKNFETEGGDKHLSISDNYLLMA